MRLGYVGCPRVGMPWRALVVGVVVSFAGLISVPANCQVVSAEQLKIKVNAGEGDSHRQGDKKPTAIEVQVLNEVDLPQPDAEVKFEAPLDGPGVMLDSDKQAVTVKSDAQGIARVEGVIGNDLKGAVTITVSASFEGKSGTQSINQVIQGRFWTRNRKIVAAAAASATAVILWEFLKPGPPTATINAPTSTATAPAGTNAGK